MSTENNANAIPNTAPKSDARPKFNSPEEEIAFLRAENARLATNKTTTGGLKISEKGALSVYGLGRFPVTLHFGQMESLLAMSDEIKAFMAANVNHPMVVKARAEHEARKAAAKAKNGSEG